VLAQQPIDSWTFDEHNGTIAHNSITGRANGTLTNGAVFVPGIAGNAVYLPPLASVNFPLPTGNLSISDFTISFWLKTNGDGIGNATAPMAEVLGNRGEQGDCSTPYIDFRVTRTGSLVFEVTDYSCSGYVGIVTEPNAGTINDGNWHLVTAVRQGTQVNLYVDGALRATGTSGGIVANVQSPYEFAAGANPIGTWVGFTFNGMIDGVQIYDRALSEFELQTPNQKIAAIIATIISYNLPSGITTSLTAKANAALADISNGAATTAVNVLQAFINQCNAQNEKGLTTTQANELISLATETITSLQ
jgi:hypothetical protein